MAITVVLADDHVIVRNGIKALLENEEDIRVIGEASNGKKALEIARDLQPDIILMDISMPVLNGIEATRYLPEVATRTKSLILSMYDREEYVFQSIESGASGYLLKDSEKGELLKAIKEVANGGKYFSSPVANILAENYLNSLKKKKEQPKMQSSLHLEDFDLTKKEIQILELVARGMSNKEIAHKLDKSIRTVETQRFHLMKKLGLKNVVELVNFAKEHSVNKG